MLEIDFGDADLINQERILEGPRIWSLCTIIGSDTLIHGRQDAPRQGERGGSEQSCAAWGQRPVRHPGRVALCRGSTRLWGR